MRCMETWPPVLILAAEAQCQMSSDKQPRDDADRIFQPTYMLQCRLLVLHWGCEETCGSVP